MSIGNRTKQVFIFCVYGLTKRFVLYVTDDSTYLVSRTNHVKLNE